MGGGGRGFQDAVVAVALPSHATVKIMNLAFAVTVNVPDPVGPVSQVSAIVSGPAGAGVGVTANAVADMARAPAPARNTAVAVFKIDIVILLPEQPIRLSG